MLKIETIVYGGTNYKIINNHFCKGNSLNIYAFMFYCIGRKKCMRYSQHDSDAWILLYLKAGLY